MKNKIAILLLCASMSLLSQTKIKFSQMENPSTSSVNLGTQTFSAGTINGSSFVKNSGTSSQFLKADGSVDANTYLTTASGSSTYVPLIRSLTINGTAFDLSSNRTWNVGDLFSTSSYTNPSWISSLAWGKISSTPTTLSGYNISDGVSTGGSYSNPSWITSLAWSKLSGTPTTLSGYSISDGWNTGGNTIASNTSYLGTNDNYALRFKVNNSLAFSIDSNKICRTFSTTAISAINGSFWYNGSQAGANGFTFYSDDASNLSPIVTFSNSSNYLSLYQDHTVNNWLYVPNGYNIVLSNDGGATQAYDMEQYSHSWNIQKRTSGTGVVYQWSCPNSTSLTAGTEATNFNFIVAGTTEFQTGALPKQRFVKVGQPTVKFIGASTASDDISFYITGAPVAGTNATQTNATSLKIGGITGTVSVGAGTTNSYGLWCYANQGATNNYAASFMGGAVGIGTVAPIYTLQVIGNAFISSSLTTNGIANSGSFVATTSGSFGTSFTVTGASVLTGGITTPTVFGSSASGGTLTLLSTSHATKGFINMGTGFSYDETNKRLRIGSLTAPTALLHLAAGTTAASTAPLKFTATSTSLMTTPEAGAVEVDASANLYYTPSATRYRLIPALTGSATLDFPSTLAQTASDMTLTVTGAVDGDPVDVGSPNGSIQASSCYSAWVSATDVVTVRFSCYGLTAKDPASGTFKVTVFKN